MYAYYIMFTILHHCRECGTNVSIHVVEVTRIIEKHLCQFVLRTYSYMYFYFVIQSSYYSVNIWSYNAGRRAGDHDVLHAGAGDERGLCVVGPTGRLFIARRRSRRQRLAAAAGHSRAAAARCSAARAHTALVALPVRSPAARSAISLGLTLRSHTGVRLLHLSAPLVNASASSLNSVFSEPRSAHIIDSAHLVPRSSAHFADSSTVLSLIRELFINN